MGVGLFLSVFSADAQIPVQTRARTFLDLNGTWKVHPNRGLTFNFPAPEDGWKDEAVPQMKSSLILPGNTHDPLPVAGLKREGKANFADRNDLSSWYRRKFPVPAKAKDKVVILTFNCMTYKTLVWLNGKKIGECLTGYAPTSYDVTDQIKWGEENDLVVGLAGVESLIDLENETYLAPYGASSAGILGDVAIEIVPCVHIDDIFIKTSVSKKTIEVQVGVVNDRKVPAQIIPNCVISRYNDRRPCLEISGSPVELAAGERKTIVLSKSWTDPVLWSPDTPFLYVADCALDTPSQARIDEQSQRFGFREFEIKGKQFFLNGKQTTLYRDNAAGNLNSTYQQIYGGENPFHPVRASIGHPFNHYRVWGNNPLVARMGDEMGATLAQVLAVYIPKVFPVDKQDIWLPNLETHIRKVMKNLRNSPAIVIWNMTNETYWGSVPGNPEMKKACKAIADTVRSMDSTRPLDGDAEVGWDGLLDVTSIHYPGLQGEFANKYANSGPVVPNDIYWLKEKGNRNWRAEFDWDKPLSIGEDFHLSGPPAAWAVFGGEDVYNWVKYSMQDKIGASGQPGNSFTDALMKVMDAYRVQGVACLNPWMGNAEKTIPRDAVRPLDFYPNFYGGKTAARKVAVFYGSYAPLGNARLQCFLTIKGRKVWEKSIPVPIQSGEQKIVEIPVTPPVVERPECGELTVRLRYDQNNFKPEQARYSEKVFILPETSLADIDAAKIALWDPSGEVSKALQKLGLSLIPLKALSANELAGKRLLLVAGDADLAPIKETVLNFADSGGNVVFLQRQNWEYMGTGFPEQDKGHVASRVWKRSHGHPVVAHLDDGQLSYWRPDNLVAQLSFRKPVDGDFKVMLDCAGGQGMEWTPLCETSYGKGMLLFSQLSLTDRLGIEPAADHVIAGLIRYGLAHHSEKREAIRLLCGENKKLEEIFTICRIDFTKGLKGSGPVFLDASYSPSSEELKQIKEHLENGGKAWLHGFTPETISNIAPLLPFKPALTKIPPEVTTAVRLSDSPLMDNLNSSDFAWAKVDLEMRGDYLEGSIPTAKIGGYALSLPTLHSGDPLLEPALLVGVPVKKGEVLFDTLEWEKAFDTEGERVMRIVSALALNQGAIIAKPKGAAFEYFHVDLAKFANMGYVDEVAEDGKGGWLDMGKADLCFFLTNHTGLGGGVGAPVAVQPFPEDNRFCGVPFKLTDPKKNGDKAMIALRSTNRAKLLPDKITDIPVNQKASQLWFIHAANYVPEKGVALAKYVIHYADGTSVEFPLRSGMEINDWSAPQKPEKAKICWTGNNRVQGSAGLFLTEWKNPFPEKEIKSIDIVGALGEAQLGVVGITGGRSLAGNSGSATLGKWDFGDLQDGKVTDSAGNAPLSLALEKNAGEPHEPTKVELDGQTGLKLDGSQYFTGDLAKIAGFDSDKPFLVKIGFSLASWDKNEKKGYGIFEAFQYLTCGYRLMVDARTLRLALEYYPKPDGKQTMLIGKTNLEMNKIYHVTITFDTAGARLYLNNNLESMKGGGMPKPFKQAFTVGRCSGAGTLNGALQSLELSALN